MIVPIRRPGVFAATIAAFCVVLSVAGAVVLMDGALHIPRRPLTGGQQFNASIARWAPEGAIRATVTATDGTALRGWYVRPVIANGDAVILLHGVADNRLGVVHFAPMLLSAGYSVLLPDSRAHGESGGDVATYGLLESGDIRRWIKWIDAHQSGGGKPGAGCVYLLGESMGAAIALQAASAPQVCAVVAEAPFASFREIAYERIAQGLRVNISISHVVAYPLVNAAFLYARLRYGLDFNTVSPEKALAAPHAPALLIAGLKDDNIPPRHAERIIRLVGPPCELWRVPGAGHTTSASVDPDGFQRRVLSWFAVHRQVSDLHSQRADASRLTSVAALP